MKRVFLSVCVCVWVHVMGQIGGLEDHYHFHHSRVVRRAAFALRGDHSFIHMDPRVSLRHTACPEWRLEGETALTVCSFLSYKWTA